MKNTIKRYQFYLLLGVLCALSSFFYTQAGLVCTNYVIQSIVPAGTLMASVSLDDHIPWWRTVITGFVGIGLVKTRMEFSGNRDLVIGTKLLQAMIPLGWTLYFLEKKKRYLKWCALLATWMEIGIQACC